MTRISRIIFKKRKEYTKSVYVFRCLLNMNLKYKAMNINYSDIQIKGRCELDVNVVKLVVT